MSEDYGKEYKNQKRIVVYASDAEDKTAIVEESERTGKSVSELVNPKIKELADDIRQKNK